MIYLATPYSAPRFLRRKEEAAEWRSRAYALAVALQTHLTFDRGIMACSPIAVWHPAAMTYEIGTDAQTFELWNLNMLKNSESVWVANVYGVRQSYGVAKEIEYCKKVGLECALWDSIPHELTAEWHEYVSQVAGATHADRVPSHLWDTFCEEHVPSYPGDLWPVG